MCCICAGTGAYERGGAAVKRFTNLAAVEESLQNTRQYWAQMTGGIRVKTPDASMDLMLNGRLLYQTVACRLFARSAFYQCGGAYGYRDQLQDVLALCRTVRSAQTANSASCGAPV